jgi:hypothetical protein
MNHRSVVSPVAGASGTDHIPPSLPLPLNVPRTYWPALIDHAAAVIAGRLAIDDRERLDRELRSIAGRLRRGDA